MPFRPKLLPMVNGGLTPGGPEYKSNDTLWKAMQLFCVIVYGSYTVMVHLCEEDGQIPFSSSSMVLLIEITKIGVSLALYSPQMLKEGLHFPELKVCLLFIIPALLYCINNNISVHMQLEMDPTTYQVLGNMKIATTAILYRVIIRRHLTNIQWFSLLLLTLAGVSDSYGGYEAKSDISSSISMHISFYGLVLILIYCVLSGLAGVYTEYVLKKYFQTSLHIQNILLYTFGIVFNGGTWLTQALQSSSDDRFNIFKGYSSYTWILIFTQAANGLIMSAVMKHASNITRLFIISCAMLVTTSLSLLVFNINLNIWFFMAFLLVLLAIGLYHR